MKPSPLLVLSFAALAASAQVPNPIVNGVYVPEYKGGPAVPPGATAITPLQTELIGPLDISRLHPGTQVLTKLSVPWSGSVNGVPCSLRSGSILTGHIAEVDPRTKQNRVSRATILFDTAECGGTHGTPFPATLVSLLAGTLGGDANLAEGPALADAVGLSTGGGARSASAASAITDYSPLPIRRLPSRVVPGQVVGLSRIRLSVGSGLNGGSVVSSPNHDLRLEATTHLILVPRSSAAAQSVSAAHPAAVPPSAATRTLAPVPPPPEPVDETTLCAASCNTVSESAHSLASSAKVGSLSISALGYSPKDKREVTSFGYDATISYLDAQNLLFTFDPHGLRERGGGSLHEATRVVRAVLMDPSTRKIKRMVDWRVQGEGRYIWRVGNDHLLVHVGNNLRLLGPDLTPIRTVSVSGPIAWISASPSGNRFAVGTYDERHSPETHRQLLDVTGEDPEEDIDIQVFDGDLHLLLSTVRSTATYPPVLSDTGEIRMHSSGRARWQISEYRWDRTSHDITHISSSCRPIVSTQTSGYLFVVGCDPTPGSRWYRMLRPDGHPVLKGLSSSEEIEQASVAISPREFAVRIVKADRAMLPGQPFHKSDLQREEISIYRSSDGHRLFSAAAAEVPLAEQSFAVSPSGDQMTLIGDTGINFYAISDDPAP